MLPALPDFPAQQNPPERNPHPIHPLPPTYHRCPALPNFPHTANPIPLQNEPAVEYDKNMNPLRDELLDTHFQLEHNRLVVPQGVGLGVTVNSDVLNRYTVAHTVCE